MENLEDEQEIRLPHVTHDLRMLLRQKWPAGGERDGKVGLIDEELTARMSFPCFSSHLERITGSNWRWNVCQNVKCYYRTSSV